VWATRFTDNKRVLILTKYDWSLGLIFAHVYVLYMFDRTEAGIARQFNFLSRPVDTNGLIMMAPQPDRRMGKGELATFIATAKARAPSCVSWEDPHPYSVLSTIMCAMLERTAWELERPVRIIQRAWRASWTRQARRRKLAVALIEDAVLEAMYRPGSGWRYLAVRQLRWDTYAH
jgi:hypothetical protein